MSDRKATGEKSVLHMLPSERSADRHSQRLAIVNDSGLSGIWMGFGSLNDTVRRENNDFFILPILARVFLDPNKCQMRARNSLGH